MRKSIAAVAFISLLVFGTAGCRKTKKCNGGDRTCNIVLHLPLDASATDISPLQNKVIVHGTLQPVADRNGIANSAMSFDGVSSYLEIKHHPKFSGKSILVSAWVYPTAFNYYDNGVVPLNAYSGIFSKWDNASRKGISTYCTDKQIRANGQFADNSFYDYGFKSDQFLVLNQWQHVAYEIKNGVLGFYLNGKLVGSKDYKNTCGLLNVDAPIEIGRTHWYPSNAHMISFFTGAIDDVKVYYDCPTIKIKNLYNP
jgi:Concanavalin A-like lectin/glucanases superfamily